MTAKEGNISPDGDSGAASVRKGRKYDQVLDGARVVFMRDGFDRANVDDIVRVAGVSKATLYSYFADKRLLFYEVARLECDRQAALGLCEDDSIGPVDAALYHLAGRITRFFLSDFGLQIYRICVAESHRFPELGQRFYASGPGLLRERLSAILHGYVARGVLVIDDIEMAANQFCDLCKSDLFARRLCGLIAAAPEADIDRVAMQAAITFHARYGAPNAAP